MERSEYTMGMRQNGKVIGTMDPGWCWSSPYCKENEAKRKQETGKNLKSRNYNIVVKSIFEMPIFRKTVQGRAKAGSGGKGTCHTILVTQAPWNPGKEKN